MIDFDSEQLLGYEVDALDEPEREQVRRRLASDPAFRHRSERLRDSLVPLAAAKTEVDPPEGLANRTCLFVAEHSRAVPAPPRAARFDRPAAEPAMAPPERSARWSWQDMTVAAAIVLAAAALIFPAIQSSRFNARVAACQENLRELGMALGRFSRQNNGYFPRVPEQGPLAVAGIYAPTLVSQGYLTDNRRVVCPASLLAEDSDYEVSSLEALEGASGKERERILPVLGGSYGYSLGYMDGDRYHHTKNLGRPQFAVMADMPNPERPGSQSDNHGGVGQNVLFEDGHVKFCTSPKPVDVSDHIFTNALGQQAPGSHFNDAVVVPSATQRR